MPNTHDIKKLGLRVAQFEPTLYSIFPRGTEEEKETFRLLKRAYVDARYKKSYRISEKELDWLAEKVTLLQERTKEACMKHLKSLALHR